MLLVVRVGRARLALPALTTREVVAPLETLGGVAPPSRFRHEGQTIALLDLRTALGLSPRPRGRVVLGGTGGQRLGVVVDEIVGRLHQDATRALPLPDTLPARHFSALLAFGQFTLRTELAHLFTSQALAPLKDLAGEVASTADPLMTDAPAVHPAPLGGHVPLDRILARAAAKARTDGGPLPGTAMVPASAAPPTTATQLPAQAAPGTGVTTAGRDPATHAAPVLSPATEAKRAPRRAGDPAREKQRAWSAVVLAVVGLAGLGWGLRQWHQDPAPPLAAAASMPTHPVKRALPQSRAEKSPRTQGKAQAQASKRTLEWVVNDSSSMGGHVILHRVVAGDTLWAIAQRYIHDPWAYRELATRSGIHDPDLIHPGDQVHIVFRGKGHPAR
jgi:nucleoid-associated protein YgaU/chemotaxis signal transduction protein